jgi:hypothetical protein
MHHSRTLEDGIAQMARELAENQGAINGEIVAESRSVDPQLAGVDAS